MDRFFALLCLCAVLFWAPAVFSSDKDITFPRESLEMSRGDETICGSVSQVEGDYLFIKSNGLGNIKIEFDDFDFPRPLGDFIKEKSLLIATGRFHEDVLLARRVVVDDGISRRTFVSKRPVEVELKGRHDLRAKIND